MAPVTSFARDGSWDPVSVPQRARAQFLRLPPRLRLRVLHALGRYAPWEDGFDFTAAPRAPGEVTGPPDFVGIGAQKAGTTWWYGLMVSHPELAAPVGIHKERHFFDRFATIPFEPASIAEYHSWFPRRDGQLAGEWTPDYAAYPWVPPLLARAAPEAKLLLLVRDPVDRFRSGLAHAERMGAPVDAADAVGRGFYFRALRRWLEHFPRDQILVLQYERCLADPDGQLSSTFSFLGLPDHRPPTLGERLTRNTTSAHRLDPDVIARLVEIYEADVSALASSVADLDLARWPNFAYLAADGAPSSRGSSSPTRRT